YPLHQPGLRPEADPAGLHDHVLLPLATGLEWKAAQALAAPEKVALAHATGRPFEVVTDVERSQKKGASSRDSC
ncbi:MAG: hypothetical protein NC238_09160, partial [Dehalobacter sp.]|nr:hypothetical protein [Dehalobacter sp.]